jgi:hypothetical protein
MDLVTTTHVGHKDEPGPSVDLTAEAVEITGVIGEADHHDLNVNMTQAPFQLLKAERDLLTSCLRDHNYKKRGGNIDWDKIENIFEDKADGCKVFRRDRKRLRSTYKKFKIHANEVSTTNHDPEGQELVPIGDMIGVTKVAVTGIEEGTIDGSEREIMEEAKSEIEGDSITQEAAENITVSAPTNLQSMEPKRRVGTPAQ